MFNPLKRSPGGSAIGMVLWIIAAVGSMPVRGALQPGGFPPAVVSCLSAMPKFNAEFGNNVSVIRKGFHCH